MQIIPLTSDGARRVSVDLGGDIGVYTFTTYYCYTSSTWLMDIHTDDDVAQAAGLALVPNINILQGETLLGSTLGQFRIADRQNNGNATPTSLGGDGAVLVHFSPGEYETLVTIPTRLPVSFASLDGLFT